MRSAIRAAPSKPEPSHFSSSIRISLLRPLATVSNVFPSVILVTDSTHFLISGRKLDKKPVCFKRLSLSLAFPM